MTAVTSTGVGAIHRCTSTPPQPTPAPRRRPLRPGRLPTFARSSTTSARGVELERYDDPELQADADGIHTLSDGLVAWFKDPDGNTLAIEERR